MSLTLIGAGPSGAGVAPGEPALIEDYEASIDDDGPLDYAMGFYLDSASSTVFKAQIHLKNSPSGGNVTLRVETDNAGEPSGTLVDAKATATVNADPGGGAWVEFEFDGQFSLAGSTDYWLVANQVTGAHRWNGHRNAPARYQKALEWVGYWQSPGATGALFRVYDMSG
jgi:hypothetical protein